MIAGGAIGGAMAAGKAVAARSNGPLRIAVVGCGRRARALLDSALSQEESLRVIALGDAFASQVQATYRTLKGRHGDQLDPQCLRCSGWDAYEQVMRTDADLVYLATPPAFRPEHFEAAIEAGKHVFLEKPLASDVGGAVRMLGLGQRAAANGLCSFVGFQRRFDACYQETVERVRSGDIGRLVMARAYSNVGALRKPQSVANEERRAFEVRNWNHFSWTGGDLLLEHQVAGLDRLRAAIQELPTAAFGLGGWSDLEHAPTDDASHERAFDHQSVEFEFGSGFRLHSQCRREGGSAWMPTGEHLHGSLGRADLTSGRIFDAEDRLVWKAPRRSSGQKATAAQQRFVIDCIRSGEVVNDVGDAAESTLMALLGQAATRSGRRETWDQMLRSAVS